MYMEWPGIIGRGRREWEHLRLEKTKMKSGLARTDSSYCWAFPRRTKRVGTHAIIVEYYIYIYTYIYIYILLLFRLINPLRFFHSENANLKQVRYFGLKSNTVPEPIVVAPPSGGFVGGPENVTKIILFEPAVQKYTNYK